MTREEIRAEGLAEPISHFTDAVLAGGLLFVSGVVAVDGEGRLVGGDDVVAQARQDHAGDDAARQCVPTGPRQVDLSAIRS